MSFYIIYLFIVLAFKAIFVESQPKESSDLYEKFCAVLDDAHRVRNGKEWLKLRENNKQPPTEDKNGAFAEWSYRYYSIERFFDYCYFLKNAKDCDFSMQNKTMKRREPSESINQSVCKCNISDCYDGTKFRHIALKPEFQYERGDPMSIGDAMRKIVDAYKSLAPGKLQQNLQRLYKNPTPKQLPKMDFCNKEDCIKVDAWVYYAKNGGDSDVATSKLKEIQKHLLKNVPLNLKEFPPQPPQNKQQTAEKPKTKLQKYPASSSSSPRGQHCSYHTDYRQTVLVTLEHPVQATTVGVLEVAMVEVVMVAMALMGSIVILVIWIVLPVRGSSLLTSSFLRGSLLSWMWRNAAIFNAVKSIRWHWFCRSNCRILAFHFIGEQSGIGAVNLAFHFIGGPSGIGVAVQIGTFWRFIASAGTVQ
uniref:Uncharacterized protein n=1 Tax=Globodera rostochiensis TaxID=31243 RepID=A0A914IF94_GLORO